MNSPELRCASVRAGKGLSRSSHATLQPARVAAAAAALVNAASMAQGLPTGATVVQGQATMTVQGNAMTVTNSRNAAIDWRTFDIGAGQSVHFRQPDAQSNVLNRVVGTSSSNILGQLTSNGGVWLLNPHGILFGSNARIDVAQMVAATMRLDLDDWRRGRVTLAADPATAGTVRNDGFIATSDGGRVVLAGTDVTNTGTIQAPGGRILMMGGRTIALDAMVSTTSTGNEAVATAGGRLTNSGVLDAAGGAIGMQAAVVNHTGIARATSMHQGVGGTIELRGAAITAGDGSVLDVSGAQGGGDLRLTGERAAAERADAPAGVVVAPNATLRADALDVGHGGRIQVWGDDAARIGGNFSVQGGARGGDGGFIDTSGGWLDLRPGSMRLGAAAGRPGLWRIDPHDVSIVAGSQPETPITSPFSAGSPTTVISATQIETALERGSLEINTGTTGTQPGNITMTGVSLLPDLRASTTLTLVAAGDITMTRSTITPGANSGVPALDIQLRAGRDIDLANSSVRSTAGLVIDALGASPPSPSILLQGGRDLNLTGSTLFAGDRTVDLQGARLTIGRTAIEGRTVSLRADNVMLDAGTNINATSGSSRTSLLIAGRTGSMTSFVNNAGPQALTVDSESRWIVVGSTPASTTLGSLTPAFRQYAAGPATDPIGTGNGVLYALAPVLTMSSTLTPLVTRVYDATTQAPQTRATIGLTGFAQPDEFASVAPTFSLAFTSPDVGTAVPLTATLTNGPLTIAAGPNRPAPPTAPPPIPVYGYAFQGTGLTGSITPATLTYVAQPASGVAGSLLPSLTGSVSGFRGNDTQGSTINGTLTFTTPATLSSPPGSYAAVGAGLTARNYVFVQDAGNATSVTLVDGNTRPPTWDLPLTVSPVVTWPPVVSGHPPVTYPITTDWPRGHVTWDDPAKDWLLGPSIAQLNKDPGLASLPACDSAAQGLSGTCLLLSDQRAEYMRLVSVPLLFMSLPQAFTTIAMADRMPIVGNNWVALSSNGTLAWSQQPSTVTSVARTVAATELGGAPPPVPSAPPTSPSPNDDGPLQPGSDGSIVASNESCAYDKVRQQWDCLTRVTNAATRQRLQNQPICKQWRDAVDGTCRLDTAQLTEVRDWVEGRQPWAKVRTLPPSLPDIKRKHALLMGIGSYAPPMALPTVASDLDKLCRKLHDDFGYSVKVLLDPSREQIVAALNLLYADMKTGDSALVQFAGQGLVGDHDGYWITGKTVRRNDGRVDIDPKSVITNADVVKWMKGFEARQVLLLADTTFQDGLKREVTPNPSGDVNSVLGRPSAMAWTSNRNEPMTGHHASLFVEGVIASLDAMGKDQPYELGNKVSLTMMRNYRAQGMPMTPRYVSVTGSTLTDYVFEHRKGTPSTADGAPCTPSRMPTMANATSGPSATP